MEVLIAVPPVLSTSRCRPCSAGGRRASDSTAGRDPGARAAALIDGQQMAAHLKFDAQLVTKMRGYVMGTPPSHAS